MSKLISYFSLLAIAFILSTSIASPQQVDEEEVFPEKVQPTPTAADEAFVEYDWGEIRWERNETFDASMPFPSENTDHCQYPPIRQPGESEEFFELRLAAYQRACPRESQPNDSN